jgi:bacillopeptidase F (M6 metalloprotease family)
VSGGTWHTLTGRTWQNGPSRKITPNGSSTGSYTGWGGNSAGYRSSRVDVSFLVGKKVQFRWRMTWDKQTAVDGWTIDDVRVYGCK